MANTKRCSRCKRSLERAAFGLRAASKDGLQNYCRECVAEWARERRPRKLTPSPEVPAGLKWCRPCGEVKPVADFAANKSAKDGLQAHCRKCQAKAYRDRRVALGKTVRPLEVPHGHKFCRTCESTKPLTEWSGNARASDGLQTRCKACTSAAGRREHLRRSYGITEPEIAELLASQGGLCAICQSAVAVHIDHDHATGRIRGMLCFPCNAALGQFDDSAEILVRAARYLLKAADSRLPIELRWTAHLATAEYYAAS